MTSTVYLITGASRGIGRGLVETFLARSNTTVIAAVRDPASAPSQSLQSLSKGDSSRLIVVKIDAKSPTDPAAAVKTLQTEHSIDHIDVVIANAGISDHDIYVVDAVLCLECLDGCSRVGGRLCVDFHHYQARGVALREGLQ